jgi:hypothetical protein
MGAGVRNAIIRATWNQKINWLWVPCPQHALPRAMPRRRSCQELACPAGVGKARMQVSSAGSGKGRSPRLPWPAKVRRAAAASTALRRSLWGPTAQALALALASPEVLGKEQAADLASQNVFTRASWEVSFWKSH